MIALKVLWSKSWCPSGDQWVMEWCTSEVITGSSTISYLFWQHGHWDWEHPQQICWNNKLYDVVNILEGRDAIQKVLGTGLGGGSLRWLWSCVSNIMHFKKCQNVHFERFFIWKQGYASSRLSLLMKSSRTDCFLETFLHKPLLDKEFPLHYASLYSGYIYAKYATCCRWNDRTERLEASRYYIIFPA